MIVDARQHARRRPEASRRVPHLTVSARVDRPMTVPTDTEWPGHAVGVPGE